MTKEVIYTGQPAFVEEPLRSFIEAFWPPEEGTRLVKVDQRVWAYREQEEINLYAADYVVPVIKASPTKTVELKQWALEDRRTIWLAYVPIIRTVFWMPG